MSGLWLGYKINFLKNKQTKKNSAGQQGSEHGSMMKREGGNQA